MKTKMIFGLMIAAASVACQKQNTEQARKPAFQGAISQAAQDFSQKYEGVFVEPDFKETLTIGRGGLMVYEQVRQVGHNGEEIPYPTVCSYAKQGVLTDVQVRTAADKKKYMDYATHILEFTVLEVVLTDKDPTTKANPNCQKWADLERKRAMDGSLNYSLFSELLGRDTIRLHTSGGGDSTPGSRSRSTLDEIFVKRTW